MAKKKVTKKKFIVTIIEYLIKDVEVEAEDEDKAYCKVRRDYRDSKIVLTADDFCDYDIKVTEEEV